MITNDTTLDASGHAIAISGNNLVRILSVTLPVKLTLIDLTVKDGVASGADGAPGFPGGTGRGGGVLVQGGTLVASGCSFLANSARGGLGGTTTAPFTVGGTGGDATEEAWI